MENFDFNQLKLESRSATRNHIFNIIFQLEFCNKDEIKDIVNKYYDTLNSEIDLESRKDKDFVPLKINKQIIEKQVFDFVNKIDQIDLKIEQNSDSWGISRIDKVDLAILRLAIYEICFDDVPTKVAINEAVLLAKEYSSEKSYRFINAVLAKI